MPAALAVTGAGMVSAAGRGVDAAWEALCRGESFLALDADPGLAGFAPIASARCAPIDPESLGADRRAARIMGHHTHMLLAAVSEAVEQSGKEVGGGETAFFAGMDSVDPEEGDLVSAALAAREDGGVDLNKFYDQGMAQIPPLWPLGMLNAIGFSQVAIQFDLRGENGTFSPGPEAAARALIEAAESLREEKAGAALAAGVSPAVSARSVARYINRGFLPASGDGNFPRPFSESGAAALGEGAGVLLIEPEGGAGAGAAPVLGFLRGWGRATALDESAGLEEAIRDSIGAALGLAGIAPGDVDLVVVHGAGSPDEDAAEAAALLSVFGGRRPHALATKGAFGHLLGASPIVDILMALRALSEGAVPPSPGAGEMAQDVLEFPGATVAAEMNAAIVLSRGFEGTCAAFCASLS